MAFFERHAQKPRRLRPKYLFLLVPILALVALIFEKNPSKKNLVEAPIKANDKAAEVSATQPAKDHEPLATLSEPGMDRIEKLAASEQLRKDVKVEKVWNDGTLSFKVGDDIVTVTSDGAVLHLPKEL